MVQRAMTWWMLAVLTVSQGTAATYVVSSTADSGAGSLRWALEMANADALPDRIEFNVPAVGVQTILPLSALPAIEFPLVLDGYTQPGSSSNTLALGNDARLLIKLDGSMAGTGVSGLEIYAGRTTVRGLIINRFSGSGLVLDYEGTNVIAGNFIGTDPSGSISRSNTVDAIEIVIGDGNVIGGFNPADRNLLSGNGQAGIEILSSEGNVIQGNYVGTDAAGAQALGNFEGITLFDFSSDNTIGGTTSGAGNLISGNHSSSGLNLFSDGNRVQGNIIGLNAAGNAILGNGGDGILLDGEANLIGGAESGAGNVISGNAENGVFLWTASSSNNVVAGNFIGTDAGGSAPLRNRANGILIQGSANTVGGVDGAAVNVISANRFAGIFIETNATANAILGNQIFGNGRLGIDLAPAGVNPNDAGDLDEGANEQQNAPYLSGIRWNGATEISGTLESAANSSYRIEFFSSETPDASGYGEGQSFLGATNVLTDSAGTALFIFQFPAMLPCESFVTATATDPLGNTSEFSEAIPFAEGRSGKPVILVDGQSFSGQEVMVTNSATVEIQSPHQDGAVSFTLNGIEQLYTGPFPVTRTAVIRAINFNPEVNCNVESEPFRITVLHPPVVAVSPNQQLVAAGGSAAFGAEATGTTPLAFQWRHQGTNLPGATRASLNLESVQAEQDGLYTVAASNLVATVESSPSVLVVGDAPGITFGPVETNVMVGEPAEFCVEAAGTPPLRYQWRHNGVNIPDATNQCYEIDSVEVGDGGSYTVIVANLFGAFSSDPALLTVDVTFMQAGDDVEERILITGSSGVAKGTNSAATKQMGEPKHAGKPGHHSVWYRWVAPANGIARFSTAGSSFDTLLAVYTGTDLASLVSVVEDEDGGKFYTSEVRFNAATGISYAIAIDGFANRSGDYVLSWDLEVTASAVPTIPVSGQPQDLTVGTNEDATFSVSAQGSGLQYQWLFNDEAIPGAVGSTYTRFNVQPQDLGLYRVRVTSSSMVSILSQPAVLEIGPFGSIQSRDKFEDLLPEQTFEGGGGGSGGAAGTTTQTILVGAGTIEQQLWMNRNSYTQIAESNHCGVLGGSSRWLAFRPETNGVLDLNTSGSTYDTVLAVYTNSVWYNADSPLNLVACDNGQSAGAPESAVRFEARQDTIYYAAVDGVNGATGLGSLTWRLGTVPVETKDPNVILLQEGANLFLRAEGVEGDPRPTIQWTLNSEEIPEATGTNLTLVNLRYEQAGVYRVILRNFAGATTNIVTVLGVVGPIQLGLEYNPNEAVPFKVIGRSSQPVLIEAAADLPLEDDADLARLGTLGAGLPSSGTNVWVPVFTNQLPNVRFQFVDPRAVTEPRRFYRGRMYEGK
jgi:parallel beta-helix repeat protein